MQRLENKKRYDLIREYTATYRDTRRNSVFVPQTQEERIQFLLGLFIVMQDSTYTYGYGNCRAMTDLAFIELVGQDVACDISHIRFDNRHDQSIEEINTVKASHYRFP